MKTGIADRAWLREKILRQPEALGKAWFVVEFLKDRPWDASTWVDATSELEDCLTPSEMSQSIQTLACETAPESRFVCSCLLERSGRFDEASAMLDGLTFFQATELEALRLQALARNRALAGGFSQCIVPLRRAIRMSASYRSLTANARVFKMLESSGQRVCRRKLRLAVVGNATFELLVPHLRATAFSYGVDLEVYAGAYNQHNQEILDPSSRLRGFRPEVVVIATNLHSLGLAEESRNEFELIAEKIEEMKKLWSSCLQAFPCLVIQHNFVVPEVSSLSRLSSSLPGGRARVIRRLDMELEEAAAHTPGVVILDVEQIASVLGKRVWEDERMWIQAKQYPSANGTVLLLKHQMALVRGAIGLGSKCVVLDLDNTIWGGIVGEDGLNGIQLGGTAKGEAFLCFQRYLLGLRQRGIILAVCSKNNESDAWQVFDEHPEMILKRDHISVFVANWRSKTENLRDIATKLNIGLDSIVFVDDNPMERELVRAELPEIEVPDLSEDPSTFAATLHRELLFESVSLTREDRKRADDYTANAQRQALQTSSANLEQFLASLRMTLRLRRFDSANEPRIVQLINKTNQFNLTTRRMSDAEVRAYVADHDCYTQFAQLSDRFGDSGIVGVLMASPRKQALNIDQWLMSCRVLGRQMEVAMLSSLWKYARSNGYQTLTGVYAPTAKNSQVADLYTNLGFTFVKQDVTGNRYYEADLSQPFDAPKFFVVDDQTNSPIASSMRI
jgi:FkbH-like protein